MKTLSRLVAALTITQLLILSATSVTAQSGETGIEGIIVMSPSRPGPIRKGENAQVPAAAVTFVVKHDGKKAASFTTDAEGHFKVKLTPGDYVISREDAGSAIGQWEFEAHVTSGKMTSIHWTADSGMR